MMKSTAAAPRTPRKPISAPDQERKESLARRLERTLDEQVVSAKLDRYGYVKQFKFAMSPPLTRWPTFLPAPKKADTRWRKYAFDFAWPDILLAVEIEGGIGFAQGRHMQPSGIKSDIERQNIAVLLGWTVLRFHSDQVMNGDAVRMVQRYIQLYADDAGDLPAWQMWYGSAPIQRGAVMAIAEVEGAEQLRIIEPGQPTNPVGIVAADVARGRRVAGIRDAGRANGVAGVEGDRTQGVPSPGQRPIDTSANGGTTVADVQRTGADRGRSDGITSEPLERESKGAPDGNVPASVGTDQRGDRGGVRSARVKRSTATEPRKPKHTDVLTWEDIDPILASRVAGASRIPSAYERGTYWELNGASGYRVIVRSASVEVSAYGYKIEMRSSKTPRVEPGSALTFDQIGGAQFVKKFVTYIMTLPSRNRVISWGPITGKKSGGYSR